MSSLAARVHAVLWGAFSLGGFAAALLLPVLIYLNNIAYPLHLWPLTDPKSDPTSLMMADRLASLFILVTVAGSLYHGIFRFQTTLGELGLKRFEEKLVAIGYAIIGTGILALAYYAVFLNPSWASTVCRVGLGPCS